MSTEFRLYNVDTKDLYKNKSKEEKEKIRIEMVKYASLYGIKPAARKYNTYPKMLENGFKYSKKMNHKIKNLKNNKNNYCQNETNMILLYCFMAR